MALPPAALFFLLFALPSCALALLALRDFVLRGQDAAKVRRAALLVLGAGALPVAMVVLTAALTEGAPLRTQGGWVFLGFGAVCGALGAAGAWLMRRAAAVPRRRLIKAAETVPMLLVLLNLVLVYNAAVQAGGRPL